ncbi:MAG TPA: SGNH/GDSL hydrolase family protein [Polyangia bacterium]|nr:SGNH/GDSL hydrolase family protein [Polyangia bacterium]
MLSPIVRNVATGLAVVLALSAGAHAQQPTPAQFQRATERLEAWRKGRTHVYMDDFGELKRYRAANAKLGAPAPTEKRVVFFGDSITDMWPLAAAFPGKPYVNRGISGQTTSQMLVRFRNDVIALAPAVVVILAGTNDIAGNTGPMSLEDIEANFTDMVELARAHGVRVVLSSVIPVHNYTPASEFTFPRRPPEQIAALNKWLKSYAAATGSVYLDYAAAMSDDKKMLRRDLADDGLHPNKAGYAIMGPLAEQAIAKALGGV